MVDINLCNVPLDVFYRILLRCSFKSWANLSKCCKSLHLLVRNRVEVLSRMKTITKRHMDLYDTPNTNAYFKVLIQMTTNSDNVFVHRYVLQQSEWDGELLPLYKLTLSKMIWNGKLLETYFHVESDSSLYQPMVAFSNILGKYRRLGILLSVVQRKKLLDFGFEKNSKNLVLMDHPNISLCKMLDILTVYFKNVHGTTEYIVF